VIPGIPSESYRIVAVFLSNPRDFAIKPNSIDVVVINANVTLTEQFTVTEFSIKGRVLSPKKTGIKDVRIKIDAKEQTKSDANGEYYLGTVSTSFNP
jgi:hypothetical protein